MRQIYFRIITRSFSPDAGSRIWQYLLNELNHSGIHDIAFQAYTPYWKNPHLGELTCQCSTAIPLTQIQQLFAAEWQSDTADIQWSRIHIPGVCFLWISD